MRLSLGKEFPRGVVDQGKSQRQVHAALHRGIRVEFRYNNRKNADIFGEAISSWEATRVSMTSLYRTHIDFFTQRMSEHSRVAHYTRLQIADEYIFRIERKDGLPVVNVLLSDAYRFGIADYLGCPSTIRRGDYILIARPEAKFDGHVVERAKKDGIGIGKIGALMGALNFRTPSDYRSREGK